MNRRIIIAASAGAVMAAGIAVAYATTLAPDRRAEGASRKLGAGQDGEPSPIPPAWRLAKDPATVYTVRPMKVRGNVKARTPQEDQLFKQAADVIARLRPVPEDRLQFFSWMDRADSPVQFGGWGVLVQDVTPTPEGWVITIRVNASSTGTTLVNNIFIEEYLWNDVELKYLRGSAHPKIGAEPWLSSM